MPEKCTFCKTCTSDSIELNGESFPLCEHCATALYQVILASEIEADKKEVKYNFYNMPASRL